MENPKISVIMPIYNVEDYLEESLNSLLNQTFIDNIEVLMIDDGSTDNSRYIIEKYALDYDNFHAFHKENEGQSITRNYGLDLAKGEYIHFLDADDYIVDDGYETLYNIAKEYDSDFVTAPVIRLRRYSIFDGKFYTKSLKKFDENIYSIRFEDDPALIWDLFVTNKLYKNEFLKSNNLRFFEMNKAYCDDIPFSLLTYLHAENVSISTDIFYYWRVREIGEKSTTQKLDDLKTFFDRLDAIILYYKVLEENEREGLSLKEMYLKILNHDLYLHYNKFHVYDEKYHKELVQKTKPILSIIPEEYKEELNSYKKILYKMVEEEDIDALVEFSSLEKELRENPHIPANLDEKYQKYIDFNQDILDEELIALKEEILIENDNLIIKFKKHIDYLESDYPFETIVKLIDDKENEFLLNEEDSKIIIPLSLIKDKNHMKIKVECIFDSFKKEAYLTNRNRETIESDDFNMDIGIGPNKLLYIDIRDAGDLIIEIEDIAFEDDVFIFEGVSNRKISEVYIQNVMTFEKISYDVETVKEDAKATEKDAKTLKEDAEATKENAKTLKKDAKATEKDAKTLKKDAKSTKEDAEAVKDDENYKIRFSIPHEDILSYYVRKWELKTNEGFEIIKVSKKFEFYMQYTFVYMTNMRNKILISSDFYDIFEKMNKLKNGYDNAKAKNNRFKSKNVKLKERNDKLKERNAKLKERNDKLKEKNAKLKEKNEKQKKTIDEYKSRKIIRFANKIKRIF